MTTVLDTFNAALTAKRESGGELPLMIEGGKARKWGQGEANYQAISPQLLEGRACLTCRWFNGIENRDSYYACTIVEGYPKMITALGVSDKYEPLLEREYEPEPRPVFIVDVPEDYYDDEKGLLAELKRFIAGRSVDKFELEGEQGFKTKGNTWIAYFTNNAKDKEGEIFPTVALDNYIKSVRDGVFDYPELWLAHIPGTRHGKAKHVGRIDNIVYAIGEFDNTPMAKELRKVYKRFPEWKMSHGFFYVDRLKVSGLYLWFKTYEITSLPVGLEANDATAFHAFSEEGLKMGMNDSDKLLLKGLGYDDAFIAGLEAGAQKVAAPIVNEGRETKAFDPAATLAAMTGGQAAAPVATPVPTQAAATPPNSPADDSKGMSDVLALVLSVNKAHNDQTLALIQEQQRQILGLKANLSELMGLIGVEETPASQSSFTAVLPQGSAAELVALNQRGLQNPNDPNDPYFMLTPAMRGNGQQP